MFELIKNFPQQLLEALKIGEQAEMKSSPQQTVNNIIVSGLGGSGIGGNLVAALVNNEITVPLIVNKGYSLPAFADNTTLLILCSYSGFTEETLSCYREAIEKGLKAVCITSGGKLEELALKNGFDIIKIPGGFPPRACLGYAVTQLFFVLAHHGLIKDDHKEYIKKTAAFLEKEQNQIMDDAKFLAGKIAGKEIIVYVEDKSEAVAIRLKQQINENAKMHCWYGLFPELNHNELVGWSQAYPNLAVLLLKTGDEYERNEARMAFTKKVIEQCINPVYEITAGGRNKYEKYFHLIHWGDWLSYYLALEQGRDPMEIDVLNKLKSHMSGI